VKKIIAGLLFVLLALPVYAAGDKFKEFNEMDKAAQEKLAKKKAKQDGAYYVCKVGRYNIYSDTGAVDSYWWGLLLDSYTDEALDEGIFPKTPVRKGKLQVYVLGDKDSYEKALSSFTNGMVTAGWSVGMFIPYGKKAALMGYNYREKAELVSTMLHECTHQLVFYHINERVPVWFNEGIATNLETYDTNLSMKANLYNAMYFNTRADGAVQCLEKGTLVPFTRLFNMSLRSWNEADDAGAQANYSSAWASCNFIFTTKKGRKFVGKFMTSTRKGGVEAAKGSISEKDQEAIAEMVKEHITEVLLPCVKFGRNIRATLNAGENEKAKLLLADMKKEFPKSNEMKFYEAWLSIIEGKNPRESAQLVEGLLSSSDFYHPDVYYVIALGYHKDGDKKEASKAIKTAMKINPKNKLAQKLEGEMK